jgi:ABC-type bacteriocin/lantibiotic exporters, contain an N-terminal double-glycine peptidase domain
VALVGETGAGKSTLAGILLGFLRPDGGEILVGDVPVREVDAAAWRHHVTWVPQQPHLFHGTVRDNILMARPDATDDQLLVAAREAGVATFVEALPLGYDTQVGEDGARLSGGQRQRIAIARAFLSDAPFVILDEATSHLDRASETAIREAIVRLSRERTVLIVSHRLRLVSIADSVVVLDQGRVVEAGAPADLERRDGPYRRLLDARRADPDDES